MKTGLTQQVTPKSPSELELHVANRVKKRRQALGLSRETVADQLGISHQQLAKNETAKNRISSIRLYELAEILDVSLAWFFEEYAGFEPGESCGLPGANEEETELVMLLRQIESVEDKAAIMGLARELASSQTPEHHDEDGDDKQDENAA